MVVLADRDIDDIGAEGELAKDANLMIRWKVRERTARACI